MKRYEKTNQEVADLIRDLRKGSRREKSALWLDIARRLEKPNRSWAAVNVGELKRVVSKGETVIIPGKLLGGGNIDFPVTVAAVGTSAAARVKVEAAGGRVLTVRELLGSNPKGKKVRIIA